MLDETAPRENGSSAPGSATPGSATPGSATPGSATPGSATPGSATPGSDGQRPATGADPAFAAFCAAGLWPGLGTTLSAALPAAGITRAEHVTSGALQALPKVSSTRAGRLLSSFIAAAPARELCELLLVAGIDARIAGRAVDVLGPAAPRLIRDDPWASLAIPSLDVAAADRLARAAVPGIRPDDPRRSRALVAWLLANQARDGHTVAPAVTIASALHGMGVSEPGTAVRAAVESGAVLAFAGATEALGDESEPSADLGLFRYAEAEESIAVSVARLTSGASPIRGDVTSLSGPLAELDPAQRQAVSNALQHGVSILTGGPGTGKSRAVAAIVTLAERAGSTVALAAPTGRAAKRLEELCDAPASTIHRLLGAQGRRRDHDDAGSGRPFSAGFARDADWPLDEQVIVVDEASMLDVELADALLTACAEGAHVVFVGDAAQLPSIGPGRVLGDLIDAAVLPTVELTTLYRQAEGGAIARLATAVRGGELTAASDPDHEVVIVAARGSADAAHRVRQLVTDSIPRVLGIPADQVQVVTPVHRGPAGTHALNAALKAVLNPGKGTRRFDPGDRVVATANHAEAEPNGFANGEVGTVSAVVDGVVTVSFASGPAEVKGKMLVDLTHGWAITVHRAQGSEFPAVVVVLPPEASGMLSRPLVYTAMTRARRHLSVVPAVGPALRRAVHDIGAAPRRTRLIDTLRDNVSR